MERRVSVHSATPVSEQTSITRHNSAFENGMILCFMKTSVYGLVVSIFYIFVLCTGTLSRKRSSASSLGSMEESHFLQASLDSSDTYSERRNPVETTMSPYYVKSMTPSAFESTLRQKEGELASYMSRLVWIMF